MGIARIVENVGEGLYAIALKINTAKVTLQIVLLDQRDTDLRAKLLQDRARRIDLRDAAENAENDAANAFTDWLRSLPTDQPPPAPPSAVTALMRAATVAQQELRNQDLLIERQEFLLLSIQARLNLLRASDDTEILTQAWCADYSTELVGEVMTLEPPGGQLLDPLVLNIAPADENAARLPSYGQLTPAMANTPAGWAYNYMLMGFCQKMSPTWRYGRIYNINYDADTCSVQLLTRGVRGLDINQISPDTGNPEFNLNNVPIRYMSSNSLTFEENDEVVVQFEGFNWAQRKVIGYRKEPRPDGMIYQFFGTGDRVKYATVDGREGVIGYLTWVSAKRNTGNDSLLDLTATPLMSNFDDAVDVGLVKTDNDLTAMNNTGKIKPWHQPDTGQVHQQWTQYAINSTGKSKLTPWLMSQWSAALPCHALYWKSGAQSANEMSLYDSGYDYAPNVFSGKRGSSQAPESDWYQRAGLARITHEEFGTRTFIVMNDVDHVFYCYPTGVQTNAPEGEDGKKTNVDAKYVKSVNCPWPDWVNIQSIQDSNKNFNPIWQFSPSGLKAACVTARRESPYTAGGIESSLINLDAEIIDTVNEDYPGVVELLFSIELTGNNPEDFTFTVTTGTVLYSKTQPTNQQQYPIAVGYAMRNLPLDSDTPTVLMNSLILLEYRHYQDHPDFWIANPVYNEFNPHGTLRPAFATVAVVSSLIGGQWAEYSRWLAWYSSLGDLYVLGGENIPNRDRPFYPNVSEIQGVNVQNSIYALYDNIQNNTFRYVGNIVSLDLRSLSWTIGVSVSTQGDFIYYPDAPGFAYAAIQAAMMVVTVFGEEQHRETVGFTQLKAVLSDMYDFVTLYPKLSEMTPIDANAIIGYSGTHLTVTNGSYTSSKECDIYVKGNALYDRWYNKYHTPMTGGQRTYIPLINMWFDGTFVVRPGLYAADYTFGEDIIFGTKSFSNYPFGIIHHNKVAGATLTALNALHQRTRISQNGSWACFVGPIAAKTGLQLYNPGGGFYPCFDVEQMIFDKVYIREEDANGKLKRSGESTHLALFNQAFQKTLTPADYHIEFEWPISLAGDDPKPISGNSSEYFDKIIPHIDDSTILFGFSGHTIVNPYRIYIEANHFFYASGSWNLTYDGFYSPVAPYWVSMTGTHNAETYKLREYVFPSYRVFNRQIAPRLKDSLIFPNPAMEAMFG